MEQNEFGISEKTVKYIIIIENCGKALHIL